MLRFLIIAGIIVLFILLFFGIVYYTIRDTNKVCKTKREKDLEKSAHEAKLILDELTAPSIDNVNMVEGKMRQKIHQWRKNYNEIR